MCRHVCNRKAESGDALDAVAAKAPAKELAQHTDASRLVADLIEREVKCREETTSTMRTLAELAPQRTKVTEEEETQGDRAVAAAPTESAASESTRAEEEETPKLDEAVKPHETEEAQESKPMVPPPAPAAVEAVVVRGDVRSLSPNDWAAVHARFPSGKAAAATAAATSKGAVAQQAPPAPTPEAPKKPKGVTFSGPMPDMAGHAILAKASGRMGQIIVDDKSDMPYKVQFSDGALPSADWFKASDVELVVDVGCKVLVKSTGLPGIVCAVDSARMKYEVLLEEKSLSADRCWLLLDAVNAMDEPKMLMEECA